MTKKKKYQIVEPPPLTLQEPEGGHIHDWWDDLTEEQIKDIEAGNRDLEAGRVVSSKTVWKKYGRKPLR